MEDWASALAADLDAETECAVVEDAVEQPDEQRGGGAEEYEQEKNAGVPAHRES